MLGMNMSLAVSSLWLFSVCLLAELISHFDCKIESFSLPPSIPSSGKCQFGLVFHSFYLCDIAHGSDPLQGCYGSSFHPDHFCIPPTLRNQLPTSSIVEELNLRFIKYASGISWPVFYHLFVFQRNNVCLHQVCGCE